MSFIDSIVSFFRKRPTFEPGDLVRIKMERDQDIQPYTIMEIFPMHSGLFGRNWSVAHVLRAGSSVIDIVDVEYLARWEDELS